MMLFNIETKVSTTMIKTTRMALIGARSEIIKTQKDAPLASVCYALREYDLMIEFLDKMIEQKEASGEL